MNCTSDRNSRMDAKASRRHGDDSGEQTLYESDEVALYAKAFDLLLDAAATGPDAVALIQRHS